MKKLFGTDGMRGEAGRFPLDPRTMHTTGNSLARRLAAANKRPPRLVIGRDTRESGAWIEGAFVEGARAAGATCESAGVITTPGVAFLTRSLPADAGVVISASHNPYHDNGIKIFAPDGRKLDDATERLIESDIYAASAQGEEDDDGAARTRATNDAGRADELRALYLDYLADEAAEGLRLEGFSMVLDCANGAASALAPALFKRLGARVEAINNEPDGRNINLNCGSLHMEELQRTVVERRADLGVAFDGDADRALFVDARGQLVDGDATLWVMSQMFAARGELADRCVVSTVMSNVGLEVALRSRGIRLLRTDVGDKYVLEELLRTGASVGGEQSGHIIFPRASLAGDGMLTTILLLRALSESGRALHELIEGFVRYPQVLVNVRVREKLPFEEVPAIARAARETESALGDEGRLLLRYSGTEPLARVMIEGQRQDEIERLADALAAVIKEHLGAG
jgi:phosphoglucosamine mutase